MSTTAVEKGLQFEKTVVDMLNKCGFKAWRTNQSNEADLERYKAGFDGGVDIIAKFDVIKPICRNVCFYIQCKCHKEPLTKSAISEVYAGMHARKGTTVTSLPVVFATSDASQEKNLLNILLSIANVIPMELIVFQESMRCIALWTGSLVQMNINQLQNIWTYTLLCSGGLKRIRMLAS